MIRYRLIEMMAKGDRVKQTLVLFMGLFLFSTSVLYAKPVVFQPGDYIDLFVYNAQELCGEFRIAADGYARLPLIGKVHVAGMTEDEAYESLRSAIGKYIIEPKVTISPKYSVSVMGYVAKPGVYTITGSDRIIETVALAGGYTPDASGSIEVFRDGNKIKIPRSAVLGQNTAMELAKPGDVIFAQRKVFTRGDYSLILSSVSAIALVIYYSTR